MRTHARSHATVLTICLSLAAAAAFAGDGSPVPPAPSAPPAPADATAVPSPPDSDDAALQSRMDARRREETARRARMDAARRGEESARQTEAALRAQMEAARGRLEVDAQQLAALSAQMYGPMMRRVRTFSGPPRVLIGVQLDESSGDRGARVREVSPGGPAEQAGVRAGDLIVSVNGTNVRGQESAGRVVELLHDVKPGDKVALQVAREGKTRDITVTARPDRDGFFIRFPDLPPLPQVRALAQWGGPMIIRGPVADMELAKLTPGLGSYFGTDTGVLVVRAPPDRGLGLQDGDVILSIAGRKPIDSSHVIRILGSYDPGEKITLQVMRQHHEISVATTLPAESAVSDRVYRIPKGAVLGPGPVVSIRGGDGTP